MADAGELLAQLRDQDADVAQVLRVFEEADGIYREGLKAMGMVQEMKEEVQNSSDLTISFEISSLSSGFIRG